MLIKSVKIKKNKKKQCFGAPADPFNTRLLYIRCPLKKHTHLFPFFPMCLTHTVCTFSTSKTTACWHLIVHQCSTPTAPSNPLFLRPQNLWPFQCSPIRLFVASKPKILPSLQTCINFSASIFNMHHCHFPCFTWYIWQTNSSGLRQKTPTPQHHRTQDARTAEDFPPSDGG